MRFSRTQLISLIFIIILLGIFTIVMVTYLTSAPVKQQEPNLSEPTPFQNIKPLNIKNAPIIAPTAGGGTDINSPIVKESISEIDTLSNALPFERSFTTSQGIEVTILIPRQSLQTNTWTLKTQIFGINYNTSPDQEDYEVMRRSFIEAANIIFSWVKQNNADPEKVIYVWGDKKYIQDQAETWLTPSN